MPKTGQRKGTLNSSFCVFGYAENGFQFASRLKETGKSYGMLEILGECIPFYLDVLPPPPFFQSTLEESRMEKYANNGLFKIKKKNLINLIALSGQLKDSEQKKRGKDWIDMRTSIQLRAKVWRLETFKAIARFEKFIAIYFPCQIAFISAGSSTTAISLFAKTYVAPCNSQRMQNIKKYWKKWSETKKKLGREYFRHNNNEFWSLTTFMEVNMKKNVLGTTLDYFKLEPPQLFQQSQNILE